MNLQRLWIVGVCTVLLLFGNATAKTLFFDMGIVEIKSIA